jgi:hypothetical protein
VLGSVPIALALLAAGLDRPLPEEQPARGAALAASRRCSSGLAVIASGPKLHGHDLFPPALVDTATSLRMGLVSFCAWGVAPAAAGSATSAGESTSALGAGIEATSRSGLAAAAATASNAELHSRVTSALELVRSSEVALQGGGFQELAAIGRERHLRAELAADRSRLHGLADLCVTMLSHPESFVHLAASDALCALVDAAPETLMMAVIRLHAAEPRGGAHSPGLTVRIRLAEALSRAVRRCGGTVARFAPAVLSASLRGATRGVDSDEPALAASLDDAEFRSVCLGCVSAVMVTLGDLGESFAPDVAATAIGILQAEERRAAHLPAPDPAPKAPCAPDASAGGADAALGSRVAARASASVRRAAVLLLVDVATRCGDQSVSKPWACLGDVAAALNEASAASADATVRGHAGVGLTRLRNRTTAIATSLASRKSLQVGLHPRVV